MAWLGHGHAAVTRDGQEVELSKTRPRPGGEAGGRSSCTWTGYRAGVGPGQCLGKSREN